MDIERLFSEFDKKRDSFKNLADEAKKLLYKEFSRKRIKIHLIFSRVKEFDSFCDKIRRKKYTDPINEVKDIVGLRVVCLFLSDIPNILDGAKNIFEILEEENKIDSNPENEFGYMGMHLVAKLKNQNSDPNLENSKDILFEIQIRTIAQDAWAAISHILDYKQKSQIAPELRRDFFALNGLFFVADTHFDLMKNKKIPDILDENSKNSSSEGQQD